MKTKKLSPRAKFIAAIANELSPCDARKKLTAFVYDIGQLAMTHDPDHAEELIRLANLIQGEVTLQDRRFSNICSRLTVIERQLERLGAAQYRVIKPKRKHKGKP